MYPLFETIRVKDGIIQNLEWHQKRYEIAYGQMYSKTPIRSIGEGMIIPQEFAHGLCKLRVFYNEKDRKHEFEKYIPKKIETLKLIEADEINYDLKYSDRGQLNDLVNRKENCDDVLIIKNGKVTDSSYANIVFTDRGKWFTPTTPLLEGTCRARLLAEESIDLADISVKDLNQFIGFNLINAMNDLDKGSFLKIENIFR